MSFRQEGLSPARGRAIVFATISFLLSFAAWGPVVGLASTLTTLHALTVSETALLVAVPVLLDSLARLPMGTSAS
jgi:MFS transporter, NNP family, nitrate/nitrite transporter